ncbi:MAG: PEGA domain-containing protein, partial [Bryobacteraceae bacterium]|nr:PEGA domain-containing protein [Bryobacteraceae bacterium]
MKLKLDFLDRVQAARQYLSQDNPKEAIAQLDLLLAKNPNDSVALGLRSDATRQLEQKRNRRAVEVATAAEKEGDATTRLRLLQEAAELTPEDKRVQLMLGVAQSQSQVFQFMSWRVHFLQETGRSVEAELQRQTLGLIAPEYVEVSTETVPQTAAKAVQPSPGTSTTKSGPLDRRMLLALGGGLAAIAALAAVLLSRPGTPVSAVPKVSISIQTSPADALIEIDGARYTNQPLAPGDYTLKVSRAGFAAVQQKITVPLSGSVSISLEPLATILRIDAQPAFAEWALDESPPVAVSDTQTALPSLAPGKHQVRIFAQPGGQGESVFEIETETAKAPRVVSIKPAENTLGIAFTQFGEESQVTTSPEGLSIAGSEGNVIGQTGTTALSLPKLTPPVTTSPEYIVRGQESEWRIQTTPSEAPILSLFLRTNA